MAFRERVPLAQEKADVMCLIGRELFDLMTFDPVL